MSDADPRFTLAGSPTVVKLYGGPDTIFDNGARALSSVVRYIPRLPEILDRLNHTCPEAELRATIADLVAAGENVIAGLEAQDVCSGAETCCDPMHVQLRVALNRARRLPL